MYHKPALQGKGREGAQGLWIGVVVYRHCVLSSRLDCLQQ